MYLYKGITEVINDMMNFTKFTYLKHGNYAQMTWWYATLSATDGHDRILLGHFWEISQKCF